MKLLDTIKLQAKKNIKRIVLAEGEDSRILKATEIILSKKIARITLLGDEAKIKAKAKKLNLYIKDAKIIDPKTFSAKDVYAHYLYNIRKRKGMTLEEAKQKIQDNNYLGTMLVNEGDADGMVSGAVSHSADVLRPALQIIKTKKGINTASSFFLMCGEKRQFLFADCAIVINPTASELAEIAICTAESAKNFNLNPKVAMLSFSTKGSGKSEEVEKVKKAVVLAKNKKPDLMIEGEMQVDAAIVPEIAKLKCPKCKIQGDANILIFPDLNSGNIGYKLVQRFAGTEAIGPIIQGLKKPINDLSRGCSVEDIVNVVAITALEAKKCS